ncbi:MAG: signal peptidase I [Deferribacteraceae bacterium]|jgi:signal peptidase I|nr:signal peptidase I [Deferribacteraceae bacterium]
MSKEKEPKKGMRDFFDSLVVAFVIAMIIRTFVMSAYVIPSGSMLETLQIGDHIIASKISYLLGDPKFGEIAVFEYPLEPGKDFIKRVIGEPGDTIKIVDKKLYRNGAAVQEDYVQLRNYPSGPIADNVPEFKVPEGHYFMMGDNRDSSADSRYWGLVPRDSFKGKSVIIYWSKDPAGGMLNLKSVRWDRLLNITR